jgi:hypothetical protein
VVDVGDDRDVAQSGDFRHSMCCARAERARIIRSGGRH